MMELLGSKADGYKEVNTNDYKTIRLNPYEVKPSESNFYSQENIEELADTFLLVGQQEPTVLGRVNGEFKILSGHRRNLANILNIERGYKQYERVKYLYKDMTEAVFQLSLIIGNAFTRKLTPYEETEQAERLKEALIKARDEDKLEIPGRLREVIAGLMGTSSTRVERMHRINNDLVEEAKEKFKEGKIGITAAYDLSRLSEEEQKEILKSAAEDEEITPKQITTITETKKEVVPITDTDFQRDLVKINNEIVNGTTGEIVQQKIPEYMRKKVIDIIKEMDTHQLADFICDRCNGGGGCAGICDLAIKCKSTNKHETCVEWLNTQT
jgi:ParB family chromosome partitioning protein